MALIVWKKASAKIDGKKDLNKRVNNRITCDNSDYEYFESTTERQGKKLQCAPSIKCKWIGDETILNKHKNYMCFQY